jgi:hypothetical protein
MRCTAPQLLDDRQNCRETIRLLVEQSTKAELRSLTNELPSRTNCLHSAEADVRLPRRKSGFDPTQTSHLHLEGHSFVIVD